jgi:cytoskeletal protein CcmA (bactofilin family)/predicted flap endonuclease-1-like 5' DNA nuclease
MSQLSSARPGPLCRAARRLARSSGILAALALLLAGLFSPAHAASDDEPCGMHFGDVVIAAGQDLTCDVVVVGGSALVEEGATLDGSLNAMPGSVRILGTVTGDVSAARDLAVSGEVGGNAFAIGGDIEIDGKVGSNVTAARGGISLSGDAVVEGQISARGDVSLADGARAEGDVVAGGRVDVADGAVTRGQIREGHTGSGYASAAGTQDPQAGIIQALLALAVVFLAVLFATLTALAAPARVARIADAAATSPFRLVLLGLIALLATLPAMFLVLPIVLAPLAMAMGWVGLGQAWGRRVIPRRGVAGQTAFGSLLLASLAVLAVVTMSGMSQFLVFCGMGLLLLIPIAWAYAAGIATLLGGRDFLPGRGAAAPGSGEVPAVSAPTGPTFPPEGSAPTAPGLQDRPVDPPLDGGPVAPAMPAADLPAQETPPPMPGAVAAAPAVDPPAQAAPPPTPGGEAWAPAAPASPDAGDPAAVTLPSETVDEDRFGPPLKQVLGLSPIYAELLRSAGIKGARDLAALSPDEVARLTAAPGVLPVAVDKAASWIRAARTLLAEAG